MTKKHMVEVHLTAGQVQILKSLMHTVLMSSKDPSVMRVASIVKQACDGAAPEKS